MIKKKKGFILLYVVLCISFLSPIVLLIYDKTSLLFDLVIAREQKLTQDFLVETIAIQFITQCLIHYKELYANVSEYSLRGDLSECLAIFPTYAQKLMVYIERKKVRILNKYCLVVIFELFEQSKKVTVQNYLILYPTLKEVYKIRSNE